MNRIPLTSQLTFKKPFWIFLFIPFLMAVSLPRCERQGPSDFFKALDSDRNGELSRSEWMTYYSQHTHSWKSCSGSDFDEADCNRDDNLTWKEYFNRRFKGKSCTFEISGFIPSHGKLLIIGQQKEYIEDYIEEFKTVPAGFMTYTSLQELNGLWTPDDKGAGIHYAQFWIEHYPDTVLQIGLYMVGILDEIIQGDYDKNIRRLGEWLKSTNRPVYLRIGYEFDNPQNRYEPEKYKKAYQRIVDVLRSAHVDNVAFVWHSGTYAYSFQNPMDWFPGVGYVDWFGVSFFNPQQQKAISEFARRAREYNKPLMMAEATPAGLYSTRAKLEWFKHFFNLIEKENFQAVSYINSDWDRLRMFAKERWGDARLTQDPAIKALWQKNVLKKEYLQSSRDLFKKLSPSSQKSSQIPSPVVK